MSKIQREVTPPPTKKQQPEPQKPARNTGAPPFMPAPPRPRQSAGPQAGPAQSQRAQAKTVKPARSTMHATPHERPAPAPQEPTRELLPLDLSSAPNANTCFDSGPGMRPVAFFDEFGDKQDGFTEQSSAGAALESLMEAAALDESLDPTALARLLPPGDNDGIFDVILPTGDRLGVVVSGRSSSLSYLLSPSTDKFSSRLRRHKMELEERLEQLTHRNVNITVL